MDSEIKQLWSAQRPDGIIEGWHGDGNFARTTIMYCLWKTQGVTAQPWRADLRLGAARDAAGTLHVVLSSEKPWTGKLIFDRPRHAENLRLPVDWPRINQFPEWFTVQSAKTYTVELASTPPARHLGAQLAAGLAVSVTPAAPALLRVAAAPATTTPKLAGLFADHMVLQRETAVPIWGTAAAGETVTVAFAGQTKTAAADATGRWRVQLDPLPASAESRELVVTGADSSVKISDVLVGEVWLAGGQSNMRFPLSASYEAAATLPTADDAQLRFWNVDFRTAAEPQTAITAKWKVSTPATAKDFSAVGYFFARELRQTLGCPVGVISAAWGGTPIETWISVAGLRQAPALSRPLARWDDAVRRYRQLQTDPTPAAAYADDLRRWRKEVEPAFNAANKAYNALPTAEKSRTPKPQPAWPEPQNPDPMGMPSPSRRPQTPAVSFNGMIAPLAPLALRGVIWYQGEANGSAGLDYRELFPRLIQDWRAQWGGEFPFLFVQLPSFGADPVPVAESGWPWTREAQLLTLREPRTAMAVTIDLGDPQDVHPTGKRDVGHRLALLARRDVYGEKLVASGPLLRDFAVEGEKIRLRFRETGGGLTLGQSPWRAKGVEPFSTEKLTGFYVAGDDRRWVEAEATIAGDSVIVSAPSVPRPVAARYAWANSPRANLYNTAGLPASPFRTDTWPLGTAGK
jgi:sialate O-acetylesterase